MKSDDDYGTISALPEANYTIWTTTLNSEGKHSLWLRGPHVEPWRVTDELYDINVHLQYENKEKSTVRALFEWDSDDATCACFNVMSSCENTKISEDIIWPNETNNNSTWEVRDLPTDSSCVIRVSGPRGATYKHYRTKVQEIPARIKPSSYLVANQATNDRNPNKANEDVIKSNKPNITDELSEDQNYIKPTEAPGVNLDDRKPHNVTIIANDSTDGWDVIVGWVRPKCSPDKYNVTLVGNHIRRSVLVPGNDTKAVIKNVRDEGFYYVIIDAVHGKNITRTSRNAVFPEKSHLAGLVTSIAVLAAIILLVGGFMCLKKRRADKQKRSYILDLDEKPSKDALETFDVECSRSEEYWEVGSRRLLLHEVVGEGAFGVVRRGTLGGEEVAVKMLKDFPTLDEIRSFHAEIELMRLMKTVGRHAHVLALVECCAGRRPLILTEYCSGGDLLSYLRCIWDVMVSKRKAKYYNNNIESCEYRNDLFKCKFERHQSKLVVNKLYDLQGICDTELTSRDLLSFCRQIAMGMDFLASNKVVHRDLAARNILVARDRTLKIADFGLSRDVYEENQYKQKGNGKMPVKWMALESLERKIYTTKSDIWSFGVVVWEIVTVGGSPYPDVPPARLLRFLREGYRMQRPNNCSRELYELMLSCWHVQPGARPSFGELHRRLDALLNSVCAQDYLSLEMNEDRPVAARSRYVRMIKEKLGWSRNDSYFRDCRLFPAHNHYSSPPVALPALQPA
ncbi:tyrosine-protein kinase receptor torso isoform X2 [Amyelois transitella]|nr:tyrosine-protein kinase receptor torso isoform X2 [Amyelois transitella]